MGILRRILGVFVMLAGIVGLLLSGAGLVGLWMAKPALATSMESTIATLTNSIDVSKRTLVITYDALGATATSVGDAGHDRHNGRRDAARDHPGQ